MPFFIDHLPPYRVDVFIPEPSSLDPHLRDILDVDAIFHTRDASRVLQLGLTRHILRILNFWTSTLDDPKSIYDNLPFGSRIVLQNVPINIAEARVIVAPMHSLERQLLSASALEQHWSADITLPPTIDLKDVKYVSQIHDSVCLVEIDGKLWIFKAITSYTKYLYHELKHLLIIPPHPNIISKPAHLVTKKCGFGGKRAVLGFTVEFQIHGSLRDLIPFLRLHGQTTREHEVKWSMQLASALIHLRKTTGFFYPDLRLDNIVLSESNDVVMVDFEQRGVWCEFAAPEVNAIEYVRLLAVDEEIPAIVRKRYANILDGMLPGWESMAQGEAYEWDSKGYNIPWSCLTETEQEACEVYMLGRVLWCIFEANSAPQRAAVWLSYRWEPLVEFPNYTCTPLPIRKLIDRCTRGRRPGLSNLILREGNQLVLRKSEETDRTTPTAVQAEARNWWLAEIEESEDWLALRAEGLEKGTWKENFYGRPSLREVYDELDAFRSDAGLQI